MLIKHKIKDLKIFFNFFEQLTFSAISFTSSLFIIYFFGLENFGAYVFNSILIFASLGLIDAIIIKPMIDSNNDDLNYLSGCLIITIILIVFINLLIFVFGSIFFNYLSIALLIFNFSSGVFIFFRVASIIKKKIKLLFNFNLLIVLLRFCVLFYLSFSSYDTNKIFFSFFFIDMIALIYFGLYFDLFKSICFKNLINSLKINLKKSKIYLLNQILDFLSSNIYMAFCGLFLGNILLGNIRLVVQIFGITSIFLQYIERYQILDFKKKLIDKNIEIRVMTVFLTYYKELIFYISLISILLILFLNLNYFFNKNFDTIFIISIAYTISSIFNLLIKYLLVPIRALNIVNEFKNIINVSPILIIFLTPLLYFLNLYAVLLISIIPNLLGLILIISKYKKIKFSKYV